MKDMKRAIRRHHYARLKDKKAQHVKAWHWGYSSPEHYQKMIAMMAETPQMCSCLGCGNPRKHLNELTLQEERNLLDFEEAMGSWREWN